MNSLFKSISLIATGVIVGSIITFTFFSNPTPDSEKMNESEEVLPLYWVAPMDANFRKDKPGKSPMGMDLVPVYPEQANSTMSEPNSIRISPNVINNLGVRTATVSRMALHTEIKTVGYVQYDEDQLIHIHPRVEGWIEKLHVKTAGSPVTKGQPLYEIYSPALVNAQEEMLLALDRKNKRLIKAAEDRLKSLQFPEQMIKALKTSRSVKQTVTFFTPQDGVVDNLNIREGFYVKPGTTLMSIGSLEKVWVIAEIFERQTAEVFAGTDVTMSLDYMSGREWNGKVDYVYPTLDADTRTVKIRLRFDNKDNVLKPNMFAQVLIHTQSTDDALLAPKEAVIRSGGRFKSVEVKLGRFDQSNAEILMGLSQGDKIVVSAQFLLDSESSKTSDFKRMNHQEESNEVGHSTMDHSKMDHSTMEENDNND